MLRRKRNLLRRIFMPGRSSVTPPFTKILLIKLAEQGSTVLAYDAIRTATERVGRENVYMLVFEENRFIVDLLGLIPPENVLAVETKSKARMVVSALQRLRQIRQLKIDACVDMEFFSRLPAAFAFLSGARRRVGYHTYFGEGPYMGDLLTHRVLYNPHLHASTSFSSLIHALDADPTKFPAFADAPPPSQAPPSFRPEPEEIREVEKILVWEGVAAGQKLVVFNANASDLLPLRRWENRNYVELARRFLEQFPNAHVVFSGAPSEAAQMSDLVREVGSPRCVCLAGRTSLRQLLVLYSLAEVLVTNDSGPAHFSTLTGVDAIVLFGPETPLLFAPPGPRSHPVWLGLACSPCVNAYNNRQTACHDNICMKGITVDQILEMLERIYRQRTSVPR